MRSDAHLRHMCLRVFVHPYRNHRAIQFQCWPKRQPIEGFSTQWYGRALSNPFVMDALGNSFFVAFVSASLASILGTLAAVGLQGIRGPARAFFDALIYIAVMIPGIVIGIATLIALVTVFGVINPWLAAIWPNLKTRRACRWEWAR